MLDLRACVVAEFETQRGPRNLITSQPSTGLTDAGWRSAVIYSITGTCKLLKINPVDYLTWVLPRLAAATSGQVEGLLPHDYATATAA